MCAASGRLQCITVTAMWLPAALPAWHVYFTVGPSACVHACLGAGLCCNVDTGTIDGPQHMVWTLLLAGPAAAASHIQSTAGLQQKAKPAVRIGRCWGASLPAVVDAFAVVIVTCFQASECWRCCVNCGSLSHRGTCKGLLSVLASSIYRCLPS